MGWTSVHRDPGIRDREFFEGEFPATLTVNGQIVDCVTSAGVFYAAVRQAGTGDVWAMIILTRRSGGYINFSYKEMADSSGPFEACCPARILDLLTALPACTHDRSYCKLCEGEITLDEGQWVSRALPGQGLQAAGPRCSIYPFGSAAPDGGRPFHEPGGTGPCSTCRARDWRARCRARAELRAQARTRAAAVRPGTQIRFARPLRFAGGAEFDTFIFQGRSTFTVPGSDRRYRIRNWRTRDGWKAADPGEP